MSKKADLAEKLFRDGYNCAQAVACAFADECGIEEKTLRKLSSSFGGGMARLREVCGCVSGMFLVSGMINYPDPLKPTQSQTCSILLQESLSMASLLPTLPLASAS